MGFGNKMQVRYESTNPQWEHHEVFIPFLLVDKCLNFVLVNGHGGMIAVSNILLVIVPSGFPHKFCGGTDCKYARDIAINVLGNVGPNGTKNAGNVPILSSVV